MARKNDFHAVEFFRKVRDEQAASLQGKTREEIIAFFSSFREEKKIIAKRKSMGIEPLAEGESRKESHSR